MLPLTMLGLPAAEASPAPAQGEAGFELALLMAATPGDATPTEALAGTSQDAGADQPNAAAQEQDLDATGDESLAALALVSLLAPMRPQPAFEPPAPASVGPVAISASSDPAKSSVVGQTAADLPSAAQSIPVAVVKPIPGSPISFEEWTPAPVPAAAVQEMSAQAAATQPASAQAASAQQAGTAPEIQATQAPQGPTPRAIFTTPMPQPATPSPVASMKASSLAAVFMASPQAAPSGTASTPVEAAADAPAGTGPAADRAVIVKPTLIPQSQLEEAPLPAPRQAEVPEAPARSAASAVAPPAASTVSANQAPAARPALNPEAEALLKAIPAAVAQGLAESANPPVSSQPGSEGEAATPSPAFVQVQAPRTAIQAAKGASLVQKLLQKLNQAFEAPSEAAPTDAASPAAPEAPLATPAPVSPIPVQASQAAPSKLDAAPEPIAGKAVVTIANSDSSPTPAITPNSSGVLNAAEQSAAPFELIESSNGEELPEVEKPAAEKTPEAPVQTFTKEAPASVRSAERAEPAPRPEPVERAMEELSDFLSLRRPGQVTIRLNPEELGSLTIVVKHTGGQVSAEITATNDAVRTQLSTHRHELAASLEQKGHQLTSFQVSAESPASSLSDKGQQFSQQSQPQAQLQKEDFERMARLAQASHPVVPQTRLSVHSSGVNVLA